MVKRQKDPGMAGAQGEGLPGFLGELDVESGEVGI